MPNVKSWMSLFYNVYLTLDKWKWLSTSISMNIFELSNWFGNDHMAIVPHHPHTNDHGNKNYGGYDSFIEMDKIGKDLDLFLNSKIATTEFEENGMVIFEYIGIHVVTGLVGVFFNGSL